MARRTQETTLRIHEEIWGGKEAKIQSSQLTVSNAQMPIQMNFE